MSALTPLPSPRPHAVSAASAQEAEREEEFLVASRPHLRLVTDDFVPETSRADPVVELPAELIQRQLPSGVDRPVPPYGVPVHIFTVGVDSYPLRKLTARGQTVSPPPDLSADIFSGGKI